MLSIDSLGQLCGSIVQQHNWQRAAMAGHINLGPSPAQVIQMAIFLPPADSHLWRS